jgi:hypothetical protein
MKRKNDENDDDDEEKTINKVKIENESSNYVKHDQVESSRSLKDIKTI